MVREGLSKEIKVDLKPKNVKCLSRAYQRKGFQTEEIETSKILGGI